MFYSMCQRSLKESVTAKLMCSYKINCQTYYQVLKKTIVHSIVWCTCLKFGKICWIKDVHMLCPWTYQRRYLRSYLTTRQQRDQVNSNFSTWDNIIAGVPEGSVLGSLLLNIFINDCVLFVSNSQ